MFRLFRNEKGFTMIEMMVVLIIIAVLIGGGIRFYLGYIEKARVDKAKAQIANMQAALDSYYAENNAYPKIATEISNAGIKPKSSSDTYGTAKKELDVNDPWGQYYAYKVDSATSPTKYCIISGGETGGHDVQGISSYRVYATGERGVSASPAVGTEPTL